MRPRPKDFSGARSAANNSKPSASAVRSRSQATCHDAKLVVEIDGATHSSDAELAHDARRQSALEAAGYVVVRFYNAHVYEQTDSVVDAILLKLLSLRPRSAGDFSTPHPNPPPQGGREHR